MPDRESSTANIVLIVAAVVLFLFIGGLGFILSLLKLAVIAICVIVVLGALSWKFLGSDKS